MIRLVVVLVLLVPLSHAHAMGADVSYSLLAWSPDGKAALLVRDSNSDNEYLSTEYEVIDVDRTEATTVMLTSTHRGDGAVEEGIDDATCRASVTTLRKAVREAGFRGVTLDERECKSNRAAIVRVDRARQTRAKARVAGKAALAVQQRVQPDYSGPMIENGCEEYRIDVAKTARLALAFEISSCQTPSRTRVHAFAREKSTYVEHGTLD